MEIIVVYDSLGFACDLPHSLPEPLLFNPLVVSALGTVIPFLFGKKRGGDEESLHGPYTLLLNKHLL